MYLEEMAADVQGDGAPPDAQLPDPTHQDADELAAQGLTVRRI